MKIMNNVTKMNYITQKVRSKVHDRHNSTEKRELVLVFFSKMNVILVCFSAFAAVFLEILFWR